jgi:hypothetical protein
MESQSRDPLYIAEYLGGIEFGDRYLGRHVSVQILTT